jgi:hypothetical protein
MSIGLLDCGTRNVGRCLYDTDRGYTPLVS